MLRISFISLLTAYSRNTVRHEHGLMVADLAQTKVFVILTLPCFQARRVNGVQGCHVTNHRARLLFSCFYFITFTIHGVASTGLPRWTCFLDMAITVYEHILFERTCGVVIHGKAPRRISLV